MSTNRGGAQVPRPMLTVHATTPATDIVERLRDLHRQATEERSHYYVGKCAKDAIAEIENLRDASAELAAAVRAAMRADEHLIDAAEYDLEPNPAKISKARRAVDLAWVRIRAALAKVQP